MLVQALSLSFLLLYFLILSLLTHPSNSAVDSFIYGGCSQLKYSPGTPYELNVNSVLSSLVNSATLANYNNFKISLSGSTQSDVVYGLFQCRGDLSSPDCRDCVAHAVSRLGTVCPGSTGGAMQLDGCFVKYDNISFLGVQDKSVGMKKCGPSIGYDSDLMNRRDALMGYLTGEGQYFRVGGSGEVQGVAQCIQDLSVGECRDCLGEATGQLKSQCGSASWGDMFLGKCYVRYSDRGAHSRSDHVSDDDDDEMQKTLAILIGLIAGVALVIVFLSCLTKLCEKKGGK